MKYYKGLDANMCASMGNGMKFELWEKYEVQGRVTPCKNGFHFCKELKDVWNFYDLEDSRFFEVEPGDIIVEANMGKSVTNSIVLVRELTNEDINQYIIDNLESLVDSDDSRVRFEVAKRGLMLNILVKDESWYIREEVARQGYGLDILVYDQNYYVRELAKEMLNKCKV